MNESHIAMRYDAARTTDAEKIARVRHMVARLLSEQLTDQLLKNQERTYGIRLTVNDDDYPGFYGPRDVVKELRIDLTWHQAERRIIEWVDYRPMDWWTLSLTATEEIKRRIRNWVRRPFAVRLWNWKQRLSVFERRHFGRAFDGNQKSSAIVGT